MKILILGGTIFLGRHLAETAIKKGHQITLFNRGNYKENIHSAAEFIQGNRREIEKFITDEFWDAIIDTSGYLPEDVAKTTAFFSTKTQKYVFISSVSVYKDFSKIGIKEDDPLAELVDRTDRKITNETYGALKALCEHEVSNTFKNNYLNIRPGLIVGAYDPTDRFTYWPAKIQAGGKIILPQNDTHPMQYIDVRDLSEFIIHLIENDTIGTFNVTTPGNTLLFKDFINTSLKLSNAKVNLKRLPIDFLEKKLEHLNTSLPIMELPDEFKGLDQVDSSTAINYGLKYRKLEMTIKDTLNWFTTLPKDYKLKVGLTKAQEENMINEFEKLNEI